jgi:phosphoglycerate dehydrogenase-like enzyme
VFARGIAVTNAADANAVPVAEYTLAAILFANKHVFEFAETYRRERRRISPSHSAGPEVGNWQKTIGIVGASRIGRRVMELLKPFDMVVLVASPDVGPEQAAVFGAEACSLDELLRRSDVVSLHAPSLPETRHMIDARGLGLMRDGATLINTARGALVDEAALLKELTSGRINAVLDVTEAEPPEPTSPLYDLPNVLLTPHLAGAVGDERHRFGRLIAGEVERFVNGEPLRHAITAELFARQA